MKKQYFIIFALFFFLGCARIQEPFKLVWGSSTKALEDSRATATTKTYECFPNDCFNKIVEILKEKETKKIVFISGEDGETKEVIEYGIFIKDPKKRLIVLVGVPGAIDTTEVGIFITPLKLKESKVEIVSLSSAAQKTVSMSVFEQLDKMYSEIKEIPL